MKRTEFIKSLAAFPAVFGLSKLVSEPTPVAEPVKDLAELYNLQGIFIFGNSIKTVHFDSKIDGSQYTIIQAPTGERYKITRIR